jgi:acetolactate synthase I/II/III large subunit
MTAKSRSAARALVEILTAQGVARVFCVPGESFLPVLDALRDSAIDTIVCRNEIGAAVMAEAHGKLTGRPGVVFVSRGPGATHASIGVHTARQDSTPLILFIGQVARADRERESFQEVDIAALFGPLTKWAAEIEDAARAPELVERAFAVAMQGRMGPVALALPEDMLDDATDAPVGARIEPARAGLALEALAQIGEALSKSKQPMLILGGSGWDEEACANSSGFAARADLPVALSFRRKHLVDNAAPHYVGDLGLGSNPALVARVKAADLVIALGARLSEVATQGYSMFTREAAARKLVHIHPGAEELGRVWPTRISAVAHVGEAARALASLEVKPRWGEWRAAVRAEYEAFIAPVETAGAVNASRIFALLDETLAPDAIITNGAGNFSGWLHRFYRHRGFNTQIAPTSGAMGYGLPASIAAKLAHPERDVLCVTGDGDFLMTAQELATAMRHGAAIVVLLFDNASYGTIRMHQQRVFPGRNHATDLANPDFAAFARAFGAWAGVVERTEDFAAAFDEARAAKRPALLHIKVSLEDISPGKRLAMS